jgi:hypothetical protein
MCVKPEGWKRIRFAIDDKYSAGWVHEGEAFAVLRLRGIGWSLRRYRMRLDGVNYAFEGLLHYESTLKGLLRAWVTRRLLCA